MAKDINGFVAEFQSRLKGVKVDDYVAHWRDGAIMGAIVMNFDLGEMCQYFEDAFGEQAVRDFFRGTYGENNPNPGRNFMQPFANFLNHICSRAENGEIQIDTEALLRELTDYQDGVRTGKVDYAISVHITNIDIPEDFTLSDGTIIQKLSPEQVAQKYGFPTRFYEPPPDIAEHWGKHGVEAVILGRATPAELQEMSRIEEQGSLENSITHAFYISGIPLKSFPCVTHMIFDSPIERGSHFNGHGRTFAFEPRMLTTEEIEQFKDAHQFLKASQDDRVLETAIDRFVLGRKRGEHHPNRINEPNWDKVVDYVIAMETLFLTTPGSEIGQELKYRLRVNGTLLLRQCLSLDSRTIFDALKSLYDLRSAVVHGAEDKRILKPANDFIRAMNADDEHHKHGLGRLMLVCRTVEQWLTVLFKHIGTIPLQDRPYRKKNGWDELLWPAA